jgi:glycosyltransferase involved in cell wall biosynthesis
MNITVIISTYNQPAWLAKSLWGYAFQTRHDFDIVIADDGSGEETARTIAEIRAATGLRAAHVWQEDAGFRKCEILNKAVLAARGDYLIFSDGDCIPRSDFVATHAALAGPRSFVSGGALRLSHALSEQLSIDDIREGRFADLSWLRARGERLGRRGLKLARVPRLMRVMDAWTTTPARFDGGNASVWRDALFEVNGFDAEMGYGWEDRALGERLRHAGFRAKQARHRAICVHLEHPRPWRVPDAMQQNRAIYERVLRSGERWARRGLQELLAEQGARADGASPPLSQQSTLPGQQDDAHAPEGQDRAVS